MRNAIAFAAWLFCVAAWSADETAPEAVAQFPLKSPYLEKIDDGYETAEEQEDLQQIPLEAMGEILAALKSTTTEQLHKAAEPAIEFKHLMREPAKHRGHVVQLAGVLRQYRPVGVEDNVSGIKQVFMGQTSNAAGNITTFISIDPIPAELQLGQGIRMSGVFLKRFGYLNREPGDKLTICPLVFVRAIEPWSELKQGKSSETVSFGLLEVLICIFAVIFLGLMVQGRAQQKAQGANFFSHMKERRNPPKHEGNFPAPDKSPAPKDPQNKPA